MTVAERKLTDNEQWIIDHVLRFSEKKQRRIVELSKIYKDSACEKEQAEIVEVLAEILFGDTSLKIAKLEDTKGNEKLERHRKYVGEQVRKYRRENGLSQDQLATSSGLPQSHISRIETGKHVSTFYTIEKLANALNVKMSQIDPSYED